MASFLLFPFNSETNVLDYGKMEGNTHCLENESDIAVFRTHKHLVIIVFYAIEKTRRIRNLKSADDSEEDLPDPLSQGAIVSPSLMEKPTADRAATVPKDLLDMSDVENQRLINLLRNKYRNNLDQN